MKAASPEPPRVVIAGFGLPGRFVAELLDFRAIPYSVIELNAQMVSRASGNGTRIIEGSVTDEAVLRKAGIETAKLLVLSIPDERAVCEAIVLARKINPTLKVAARCHYTSAGLRAQQLGAEDVVVEEQLVAREMFRVIEREVGEEE